MNGDQTKRRSRRLSADDQAVWKNVTRSIRPLKPARSVESSSQGAPDLSDAAAERAATPRPVPVVPPTKKEPPPLAPFGRRMRQKLARGTEPIERRLDLHGLTQREAHDALVHFLRSAQAQDARMVLVVTGKGARAADRDPFVERGVLRRLVPHWLKAPEFRNLVVGFEAANIGHGGEGALYVRLRRAKHP
jgi:DNA-nicking Smr family endonuclease